MLSFYMDCIYIVEIIGDSCLIGGSSTCWKWEFLLLSVCRVACLPVNERLNEVIEIGLGIEGWKGKRISYFGYLCFRRLNDTTDWQYV